MHRKVDIQFFVRESTFPTNEGLDGNSNISQEIDSLMWFETKRENPNTKRLQVWKPVNQIHWHLCYNEPLQIFIVIFLCGN